MKKQIKKLSISKRTIANLNVLELNRKVGGYGTQDQHACHVPQKSKNCTANNGNNTCKNTCV